MGVLENVKEVADLVKKLGNIEMIGEHRHDCEGAYSNQDERSEMKVWQESWTFPFAPGPKALLSRQNVAKRVQRLAA